MNPPGARYTPEHNPNRRRAGRLNDLKRFIIPLLALACLWITPALALPPEVAGEEVVLREYDGPYPNGTFDGTGSVGAPAPFSNAVNELGVNEATSNVIVGTSSHIYKLGAAGTPEVFGALAPDTAFSISPWVFGESDIALDNSGGLGGPAEGEQGRIYWRGNGGVFAQKPDGAALSGPFPITDACGLEVAPDGTLWTITNLSTGLVRQFDDTLTPTGASFETGFGSCSLAIDSNYNFYAANNRSFGNQEVIKYSKEGDNLEVLDKTNPVVDVMVDRSSDHVFVHHSNYVTEYNAAGVRLAEFGTASGSYPGLYISYSMAINEGSGRIYLGGITTPDMGNRRIVDVFKPSPPFIIPDVTTGPADGIDRANATLHGVVNADEGPTTTECYFEWGTTKAYGNPPVPCNEGDEFSGSGDHEVSASLSGLAAGTTYHYRVVASNGEAIIAGGKDRTFDTAPNVAEVQTHPPTEVQPTSATLNGSLDPEGMDTNVYFEYGNTTAYGQNTSLPPGTEVVSGSGATPVSAEVSGLEQGVTYHYRLVATNAFGTTYGNDETVRPASPPILSGEHVTDVKADSGVLHAAVHPGGDETNYQFEYGPAVCGPNPCVSSSMQSVGDGMLEVGVNHLAGELEAGTTYHYRVVATNPRGTTFGASHTFTTYPLEEQAVDACPNANARQQTSATKLLNCRAYELVSAADTNGYNVVSDLVSGATPFDGFPRATDRVLYGVRDGAIVGPWNPTNRGIDPYVAVRNDGVWTTEYVGLKADNPFASAPFSSPLAGADTQLKHFAFAGEEVCSPCFADGSTNVPLRMPDGSVIEGMAGSVDAVGDPSGHIAKRFSADGTVFIFGSTAQFEPDANSNGTDVTIYARDLQADTTRVVSKMPNGTTIANGTGVAALDVSTDGERTVVGRLVSTDANGNRLYHLYMHVGTSSNTIDLMPGAVTGALYGGMSEDGAHVYYTTKDALSTAAAQDTDSSSDLYRAEVDGTGANVSRVSVGSGVGNTDACTPAGTSESTHWNVVGNTPDCSVVAVSGGGGVAADSGDIFFLSPEALDVPASGVPPIPGAPNLYLAEPGEAPQFVATLESNLDGPATPLMHHVYAGSFGNFASATGVALAPDGDVYVLDTGDSPAQVERYSPTGELKSVDNNFGAGYNVGTSESTFERLPTQIAVNQANGQLHVPSYPSQAAVAINPLDQQVYFGISSSFASTIGGTSINLPWLTFPRALAVDSKGRVYVGGRRGTELYGADGQFVRRVNHAVTYGLTVDLDDDSVYINEGHRIVHLTATGLPAEPVEGGSLTTGKGITIGTDNRLYVVQGGSDGEVRYFDRVPAPNPQTDNPLVVHATTDAATRHEGDFQVSPDGSFAVFTSTRQLTGFESRGRGEVFRFDKGSNSLDCPSCPATNAAPEGAARLSNLGLSLTDAGSVFFVTAEPLVLRDTNGKQDVYEWEDGRLELVSPGSSPFDSSLLTASADGQDVFFFTRDTLVPEDQNGTLTKIYDARAEGGVLNIPPPPPCRASDECHGPGSQPPAPPTISTISGSRGNFKKRCKKRRATRGSRKKAKKQQGKCVRRGRRKKSRRHTRRARSTQPRKAPGRDVRKEVSP